MVSDPYVLVAVQVFDGITAAVFAMEVLAIGRMSILNIVLPKFDPADEVLVDG